MLRNTQRGIAVDTFYLFGVNFQSRHAIFTGRNEVVAKVIFLHLSVISSQGGSASVHAGIPPPRTRHPPRADTPRDQAPPLGADPPQSRPPRADTLWDQAHPPPREADSGIRSMSGRYASYWNAFLLCISLEIRSWKMIKTDRLSSSKCNGNQCFHAISYFIVHLNENFDLPKAN